MTDIQYNLQFDKLCETLQLGGMTSMPESLSGGLLNKMFAIRTTKGKFAVKAINPQIMLRPTAMQNYINSELIANIAVKSVRAVPARIFGGKSVQEIDGQYYLVFDWVEGKSLKQKEININHCEKVGEILAAIHTTDFSKLGLSDYDSSKETLTDWNYYLQKGTETGAVWADLLHNNIDNLYVWNNQLVVAAKMLSTNTIISHGDLDSKNILWCNGNPAIIDWEAAGFVNPMHELLQTAIDWAKNEAEDIDKDKFLAVIGAYKKNFPALKSD